MNITFVGAGNMAEALVRGLLASGQATNTDITVSDISAERLQYFKDTFSVNGETDNVLAVANRDVVFLAIKPQLFPEVLPLMKEALSPEALIISIAAGVPASKIEAALGEGVKVVRVMPNTPALVGKGVSALSAGQHASQEDLDRATQLLSAVGGTLQVPEKQLDAVTAVSGSGPAYVFYLIEGMMKAGVELGLDPAHVRQLVADTVEGAAVMVKESSTEPSELRARVTSKGGTTAAAIQYFDSQDALATIQGAVKAAHARSIELAQ